MTASPRPIDTISNHIVQAERFLDANMNSAGQASALIAIAQLLDPDSNQKLTEAIESLQAISNSLHRIAQALDRMPR